MNNFAYLSGCVQSAAAQNYPPIEQHRLDVTSLSRIDTNEPLTPLSDSRNVRVSPYYQALGIDGATRLIQVRLSVAKRLEMAAANLPHGFSLVILDGWRSERLQRSIHAYFRSTMDSSTDPGKYAFDLDGGTRPDFPTDDAPHRTGGAVDVCIACLDGSVWPMGSDFDEPTDRSRTAAFEDADSVARLGRRMLHFVMLSAGFTNYPEEWWHYDYGNAFWRHYGRLSDDVAVYRTIVK